MANGTLTAGVEHNSTAHDFWQLLKPRVMSLVVFTGIIGVALAPGELHPFLQFMAILCIAIGSGASGAINMWYDRDIDAVMKRTQHRPIPSGRVTPGDALNFGIILSLFSVMMLGIATNWMAAGLLASAILFYVCIYTMWLKRSTPQNIVIGGVAGAFPPLIGWVVMTGDISLFPLLLFGITFVWTPPHFWALALYRNEDYQKAKVPMLPVVSGEAATKRQIVLYSWGLFAFTLSPVLLGYAHTLYLAGAFLLGVIFVGLAHKVKHAKHYGPAKQLFGYSILYLFLIYGLFVIDAWVSIMLPY